MCYSEAEIDSIRLGVQTQTKGFMRSLVATTTPGVRVCNVALLILMIESIKMFSVSILEFA